MATTTSATSGVGFGTLDTSSGTPRLTGTASNIDTQALANGTEYCGKIVHAWIAALRQHPVQALAGCIGLGGEFFKANGGVHKVSQNEPGGVGIAIEK